MSYSLTNHYAGESLLSGFDWKNDTDLSNGFVSYQSREDAQAQGLYSVDPTTNVVRLGVDTSNTYTYAPGDSSGGDAGRPSIRLESRASWTTGLFVIDLLHMPASQCGTWPALWLYSRNGGAWPRGGELDVVEGANTAPNNVISAHTDDGCILVPHTTDDDKEGGEGEREYTGRMRDETGCAVGSQNVGCGFAPPDDDTSSFGDGFNAANGGVYAVEWDDERIRVWHFPRGSVPADISSSSSSSSSSSPSSSSSDGEAKKGPDPRSWGRPQAVFGDSEGGCDVARHFSDMSLVLNTNFCGDYGAALWGSEDGCGALAPTCEEYVAGNPGAFVNSYWDIKYIDVYEYNPSPSSSSTSSISALSSSPSSPPSPPPSLPPPPPSPPTQQPEALPLVESPSNPDPNSSPDLNSSPKNINNAPLPNPTSPPSNPASINRSTYLGCFTSPSFPTFRHVRSSPNMDPQTCVSACGQDISSPDDNQREVGGQTTPFAGVSGTRCFCARSLDPSTRATQSESDCNTPCPGTGGSTSDDGGDGVVYCGADDDGQGGMLMTVYGAVRGEQRPPPPPMAQGGTAGAGAGDTTSTVYVCDQTSSSLVSSPTGDEVDGDDGKSAGGGGSTAPAPPVPSEAGGMSPQAQWSVAAGLMVSGLMLLW